MKNVFDVGGLDALGVFFPLMTSGFLPSSTNQSEKKADE